MADNEICFVLTGQAQGGARDGSAPVVSRAVRGTVKTAITLAAQRSSGETLRASAVPGEDVVVLHLAGGPSLVLHPETARDLLRGQGSAKRGAGPDSGEVEVPVQLRWRGLEQAAPTRGAGFLGDVLLSGFEIVTGLFQDEAADLVAGAVVARVDGGVEAGVYALRPETLPALKGSGLKVARVPAAADGGPLLVLIHGTFVDTTSTFGKLWALHPQSVRELFRAYADRVYALDHPTLGASPFANALTLVQALPHGARLHLVTHSRGGLVAEVLARVAAQRDIGAADLAPFAGAAHATQRAELLALAQAMRERDIHVDRVVRVACPARGTLLASHRLDAYLSVLKWGLELAGVPVLPALVDFLTEVARRRADPGQLPGLAAMMPGSPLVQWLNAAEEGIAGDLRVVAGDLQGDSIGSWLKTLLADAYYWTDNDIVVQTRSMYGGAPRAGGASFLLDQGGKVTHFNYFANQRTVDAVVAGLTQAQPDGFRAIGPLSWAGEDSGGVRAARPGAARPDPTRPAVFVLPGILGSHLKAGDKRIWLSLRLVGGLPRLRYTGAADNVLPDGPIGLIYDDLITHLAETHEVIPFAYDWRRPIEQEARRLADAVDAAITARLASGEAVRIVAHSMGGLVARTMQLERPEVWQRLMSRAGARLLMLGTPNAGSWAPMQVLSGDDTFGNALAAFGSPLQDRQARQLMAEMPGFLQLQAGLLERGLDRREAWEKLATDDLKQVRENSWWHRNWLADESADHPLAAYEWGVPPQGVLDQARRLRVRLDKQREHDLPRFADKLLLVVGHARFTPDGYEWADEGLVYLDATDGGDGRVPLASALLPGVKTWTLDCEHGGLPDKGSAFAAFDDLLQQGDTERLDRLGTAVRGTAGAAPAAPAHVRSRPSRGRSSGQPAESQRAVFDSARGLPAETAPSTGAMLRVSVLNSNLSFVAQPLMVGHYNALTLTGTERAVDGLVGGAMRASLGAGLYPEEPGTVQLFANTRRDDANPWRAPRPVAAVVVGLGDEGKLRERDLAMSVRQGVIAWSQRLAEAAGGAPASFAIAAALIGSGGVGIYPGTSARAIALGVRDANDRLAACGWPVVGELTLVELYLERAADAWHGLQVLATASPGRFEIAPTIASGNGALRRQIDTGYRGADYDLITATTPSEGTVAFTLDSKRARTELRAQVTQAKLVRELVERASTASNQDPQLGRTLFQLLVPLEVEPFLGGTSHMLLELDAGTAPIPWELLDTPDDRRAGGDERPWAIRSQLLRKLRTETFRERVQDAGTDDNVLVVGEPLVDATKYGRLPGALAEARAVAQQLGTAGGIAAAQLTALLARDDASTVVNALYARRYRIVHIAGHGEPGMAGGVVMSGGTFLGPHEIRNMRTVPELVFVNCCHGAAREPGQALRSFDRSAFAAGVADALIGIGVRCVIAAGWAVDDGPAALFATTFYRRLMAGANFIAAVAAAREAAWEQGGNTWAAYQCYGDPNWTFRRSEATATPPNPMDEYAAISSPLGLVLALEELAVQSRWQAYPAPRQLEKARHLEARFAALWGDMGAVAEAFGLVYAEAGEYDIAIGWYERAIGCNDASASIKVTEQLGHLRARQAWVRVQDAPKGSRLFAAGRREIRQALQALEATTRLRPTLERHSLRGSAWTRMALLERRAGDTRAERAAVRQAAEAYRQAEALAAASGHAERFYPGLNRMGLELVASLAAPGWPGFDAGATAALQLSLQHAREHDPDFWSVVGGVSIELYRALAARALAVHAAAIEAGYADAHNSMASSVPWRSVADQAEFVLVPYAQATGGAEAQAAADLLKLLKGYANA